LKRTLLAQQPAEVGPLDVAHRDVELPVDLAGVVNGDNRRMVEGGGELRLRQEALAEARTLGEVRGEQLERDVAVESGVARAVDTAHPAAAEQHLDSVAEEVAADARVRRDRHVRLPVANHRATTPRLKGFGASRVPRRA